MDRIQIVLLALAAALVFASVQLSGRRSPERAVGPAQNDAASRELRDEPSANPAESGGVARPEPEPESPEAKAAASPSAVEGDFEEAEAVEVVELNNGSLRVKVSNQGVRITSLTLNDYSARVDTPNAPVQLGTDQSDGLVAASWSGDLAGTAERRFQVEERGPRVWQGRIRRSDGVEVTARLELDEEGYGAHLEMAVRNEGSGSVETGWNVDVFGREPSVLGGLQKVQLSALAEGSGLTRKRLKGIEKGGLFRSGGPWSEQIEGGLDWGGVETQYFLVAVLPDGSGFNASMASLGAETGRVRIGYPERTLASGNYIDRSYRLFLGPKIEEAVDAVDPRLEPALRIGYAWVRPLSRFFASVLKWMYTYTIPNYGFAIVVITLLLRLGMYPLTQKSMQSMRRMSVLAPQLKEIQEKYKGDQQRMQAELMELYKRTGVNPFVAMGSGCLPMLLQAPFMIALYYALQGMIELRHAPFVFWIDDLSAPEQLMTLFGVPIRPLALAMGGSMFLQTYLQPASNDGQQQQQRQMMLMMSLVFVVMFYSFPSGLVLYWLVSTLLGIAQQLLVNRSVAGPGGAVKQGAST